MALNPKITGPDVNGRFAAEWDPDDTAEGYGWTTDLGQGRTLSNEITKVNLGTRPQGGIPSFKIHVLDVIPRPDEVATYGDPPPPPPPPPPPSGRLWGICTSVSLKDSTRQRELDDAKAVGVNCPRIDGADKATFQTTYCEANFPSWVYIVGAGKTWPSSQTGVDYAKAHPHAMLEPLNEPNFGLTAATVAANQIAFYKAVKAASSNTKVLLASVGNSGSTPEHLHPHDWCAALKSHGCVPGSGFDIANYHMYGPDPDSYNAWMKVRGAGSAQEMWGNPPYLVTEFGHPIGSSGSEAATATACGKWFDWLKADPACLGGMWYALSDDAPGTTTGYGLRRHDLSHRPAWDVFKAKAA